MSFYKEIEAHLSKVVKYINNDSSHCYRLQQWSWHLATNWSCCTSLKGAPNPPRPLPHWHTELKTGPCSILISLWSEYMFSLSHSLFILMMVTLWHAWYMSDLAVLFVNVCDAPHSWKTNLYYICINNTILLHLLYI